MESGGGHGNPAKKERKLLIYLNQGSSAKM